MSTITPLDPNIPRPPPPAKKGQYVPTDKNDLFFNPMIKAARESITEEEKQKYEKIGEELYGTINFEDEQSINNMPPPLANAVICLEKQLQSGCHPSVFDENEKLLMQDAYGDNWYTKWGYVREDLDDIVTLKLI